MGENPIVLFDGVCNLCNSSVQFIIRHDKKKQFRFGSLQGITARKILAEHHLPIDKLDTLILVEGNKLYTHSTAALRIAKRLGGFWKLFYVNIIVPKFLRDSIYKFIARNRYKWFGKRDQCAVPGGELRDRFLD